MDANTAAPTDSDVDYLNGAIARLAARGEPLVYSITEVARLLGISRGLAYELAKRREIPTMQLGRRLVVPRTALASLLARASSPDHEPLPPATAPSHVTPAAVDRAAI
jgi:excisionase family DNA binding protein